MKFWQRIFIYSLTLFFVMFNSAGIFVINNIHKRSLDRTIKSGIDEHKIIEGSLYLNTDSVDVGSSLSHGQLSDWLTFVITGYIYNDSLTTDNLEIYDENDSLLFSKSSLVVNGPRLEIEEAKLNERSFLVRSINNIHYLFISSKFSLGNNKLKLVLAKNIDYIYLERKDNFNLFFVLDGIIFTMLAIGMFLIAKGVTKPISKLSEATKEIASGNYSKRVKIKNRKDEIGLLAENFNIMVKATEDTIEKLKDLNSAQQRFIDSLTHEMKTPLTSVIGYSDLLLKSNVTEEIRMTALNYINSEAKRLEKLNTTLMKLILIRQDSLSFERISLKDCFLIAYKSLSFKLEQKNLTLNTNIEDMEFLGDKQLIVVLFINILDNAVKASYDNSSIEVGSYISKDGLKYIMYFKDFGIGIPKEDLNKIKEPFYMADKARDRAKSGIGLGLAICEEICRAHNIELNLQSEINMGMQVCLEFPKENVEK